MHQFDQSIHCVVNTLTFCNSRHKNKCKINLLKHRSVVNHKLIVTCSNILYLNKLITITGKKKKNVLKDILRGAELLT